MITGLLRAMRPRQWTKNVLFVFPAIVFSANLLQGDLLLRVIACSALLVLASGCVYIINDLADIEADRSHPTKKNRAIAAGEVPVRIAQVAALLLPPITLAAAYSMDTRLALLLLVYLALQVAYSFWLKHVVLLDILVVAFGFVLRLMAGGLVIDVAVSPGYTHRWVCWRYSW